MIAVIADDLTGAAELGGVGLRFGLPVRISLDVPSTPVEGLLVIATDTRSAPVQQATGEMTALTADLVPHKPVLLYKKIDSVLRGHVLAEVKAQMAVLGFTRALIVPANPNLGRTIKDGRYFFHGQPIHTTSFSHDPEFAITDPRITAMLRSGDTPVTILKKDQPLPEEGIIVGEVEQMDDLRHWAEKADSQTMLVGASGFFSALLEKLLCRPAHPAPEAGRFTKPLLFVSGSTFHKTRTAIRAEKEKGGPVSYVPETIVAGDQPLEPIFKKWQQEICSHVRAHTKSIVAIDPETVQPAITTAAQLRMITARITGDVLENTMIGELFVEGGATAWAVVQQSGLSPLQPVQELAPGVVRMRVENKEGLFLTIKPGSYDWPPAVLQFIYHS